MAEGEAEAGWKYGSVVESLFEFPAWGGGGGGVFTDACHRLCSYLRWAALLRGRNEQIRGLQWYKKSNYVSIRVLSSNFYFQMTLEN